MLLTLSLSYTIGAQFISKSFVVATEVQHIQSMNCQKQLDFTTNAATMKALLPNNINDLQDRNPLKSLVRSVSGVFLEYPDIIKLSTSSKKYK